jgi:branched-chain amino acid transport system permease protein
MNSRRIFESTTKLIPIWFFIWLIYSAFKYPFYFGTFALLGISNGVIYALIAFGFGLIYNTTGMINLAHGEVFMMGAVISAFLLVDQLDATSTTTRNWIWLVVVLIFTMLVGSLLSLSTELLVFRRLRHANRIAPLIASLGVALILQNIGIKLNGSGAKKFHSIIPEALPYTSFSSALERALVVLMLTTPIVILFSYLATRSKNGLAIRAVSASYEVSQLVGINVNRTIGRVFLIAGATASAAGVIYAQEYRISNYSLGMQIGLIAYAAAIIGGVSSIRGTIFGGFFVGIVEALSSGVPSGLGYRWSETAIYAVFILMLVYRPQGILGHPEENI